MYSNNTYFSIVPGGPQFWATFETIDLLREPYERLAGVSHADVYSLLQHFWLRHGTAGTAPALSNIVMVSGQLLKDSMLFKSSLGQREGGQRNNSLVHMEVAFGDPKYVLTA